MGIDLQNNFILNGFDRCGSTAISRVLSEHPDIELIVQPFNGGSIRRKLYQVLDDDNTDDADRRFFAELEGGRLDTSYIESDWHTNHSTVPQFVKNKIHLIKTTQNHLTVKWVSTHFPKVEQWGIWREPLDILASLVRNGFHVAWYSVGFEQLAKTVSSNDDLCEVFNHLTSHATNEISRMAFMIAVRTWFYFHHIESAKVIIYERFLEDGSGELARVTNYFRLKDFQYTQDRSLDLNLVGRGYQAGVRHLNEVPTADIHTAERIFEPLRVVYDRIVREREH